MGAQSLLLTICLALLVCQSIAVPHADIKPRDSREPSILQAPKLQSRFPGLYFKEAAENCNGDQFDTLVRTVEEVIPYMEKNKDDLYNTPGWNRFFVQNEYVTNTAERIKSPGTKSSTRFTEGKTWEYPTFYPYYKMIINNFNQIINFPLQGRKNWKEEIQKDRITLTCKHVNIKPKNSCDNPGVWATTYHNDATGRGEVVVFCPNFFNDQMTKHLSQITHGYAWQIDTLMSREHVMAHEFFHAQAAVGTEEHITDLRAELPGEGIWTKEVPIYGAVRCAKYAWISLDHGSKRHKVNPQVQRNADNYAWLFTFNWFNDKFSWGSTGEYHWPRDDLKRGLLGPRSGANMTSWENTDWEGTTPLDSDDTTGEDEAWPLPNCHQVGGDQMNVHCEYMNEPYQQWMKDHGYSASPSQLPSSTHRVSSTPLIGTGDCMLGFILQMWAYEFQNVFGIYTHFYGTIVHRFK